MKRVSNITNEAKFNPKELGARPLFEWIKNQMNFYDYVQVSEYDKQLKETFMIIDNKDRTFKPELGNNGILITFKGGWFDINFKDVQNIESFIVDESFEIVPAESLQGATLVILTYLNRVIHLSAYNRMQ